MNLDKIDSLPPSENSELLHKAEQAFISQQAVAHFVKFPEPTASGHLPQFYQLPHIQEIINQDEADLSRQLCGFAAAASCLKFHFQPNSELYEIFSADLAARLFFYALSKQGHAAYDGHGHPFPQGWLVRNANGDTYHHALAWAVNSFRKSTGNTAHPLENFPNLELFRESTRKFGSSFLVSCHNQVINVGRQTLGLQPIEHLHPGSHIVGLVAYHHTQVLVIDPFQLETTEAPLIYWPDSQTVQNLLSLPHRAIELRQVNILDSPLQTYYTPQPTFDPKP